jgi:DNA-binding transcriptional LysR family regulator
MTTPDFNLLITLDAVLTEGSVARAARRLGLSPSAMSRSLARLRETTGDPLLVRAGRGLVPTPRAIALREQVSELVENVSAVLRPAERPDMKQLARSFTIRTRDGFVENFGPALIDRVAGEAPGVQLCFVTKQDRDSASLRDGSVDLETGVIGAATSPEVRTRALFRDRFVGVVRAGHPFAGQSLTPARFAQGKHVRISLRNSDKDPVDTALEALGLERSIATVVGSFTAALALARASDLVTCVPERHTGNLRDGMHNFALPFGAPGFTVSMLWHPRSDADPAHRWLRDTVFEICSLSCAYVTFGINLD